MALNYSNKLNEINFTKSQSREAPQKNLLDILVIDEENEDNVNFGNYEETKDVKETTIPTTTLKPKHPRSHCQFKGSEIFSSSKSDLEVYDEVDQICKTWRNVLEIETSVFQMNCLDMKKPLNYYVCEPFLGEIQFYYRLLKDSENEEDWCTIRYCWLTGNLVELLPLLENF